MNTLEAKVEQTHDGHVARIGEFALAVPSDVPVSANQRIVVGVRPEHLSLGDEGTLQATVRNVEMLGHEQHVICEVAKALLIVRASSEVPMVQVATSLRLHLDERHLHFFDTESGDRLA